MSSSLAVFVFACLFYFEKLLIFNFCNIFLLSRPPMSCIMRHNSRLVSQLLVGLCSVVSFSGLCLFEVHGVDKHCLVKATYLGSTEIRFRCGGEEWWERQLSEDNELSEKVVKICSLHPQSGLGCEFQPVKIANNFQIPLSLWKQNKTKHQFN